MNQEFSTDTEHLSTPQDIQADPFERELLLQLGEMLKILKQGDQPENRRQLQASCQSSIRFERGICLENVAENCPKRDRRPP